MIVIIVIFVIVVVIFIVIIIVNNFTLQCLLRLKGMIWNTSQDNMNILVNNRISVFVNTGSSKMSGIGWRMFTLLLFVADGTSNVWQSCQPLLSCGASFGYIAKPCLSRLLCLASGLSHPCNQNGMKCYDDVTCENILLEYNMQVMCNWMWCIIVDMYSMIVNYVLSIVDYDFTIVAYNFIIVDYDFTLWDYILTLVGNMISFRRL